MTPVKGLFPFRMSQLLPLILLWAPFAGAHALFGREFSLDMVEHDTIRAKGVYDDPRIHFGSAGNALEVSEIFKWYSVDFTGGLKVRVVKRNCC